MAVPVARICRQEGSCYGIEASGDRLSVPAMVSHDTGQGCSCDQQHVQGEVEADVGSPAHRVRQSAGDESPDQTIHESNII